jgi:hypothetical protein
MVLSLPSKVYVQKLDTYLILFMTVLAQKLKVISK